MREFFKALADATRLRLLFILGRGEFTVQELIDILQMGQSRISRHLKILLDAELVSVKREGTWAYYRMAQTSFFFQRIWPYLQDEFDQLATAQEDQAAVVRVLAARRERSQSFFARHARDWDHLSRQLLPTPPYQERLVENLPEASCLLEIGVGTGGLLETLSRTAGQVIGVDASPEMLNAARQRVAALGLDNVALRLGEMEHLPLEDRSVEVVLLNMVLHHAPDPATVLKESWRVLGPGGVLVVADLARHQDEWVREKLADQWLGFTAEELKNWAERCGFAQEEMLAVPGGKNEFSVVLSWMRKPFSGNPKAGTANRKRGALHQ